MTDTKDLIREIQEHTAAHGGENTATHLLVQAVMALQRQADELAAIGAGGVEPLRKINQPEPTVPDQTQDWAGMDGATAYLLIQRHADNWADAAKMMGEWLDANQRQSFDAADMATAAAQGFRDGVASVSAGSEPEAWREHVEQRLLAWRQSFVNRSGDQLALDDFMDEQSLDDLIDFVCDEWALNTRPSPQEGMAGWQPIETAPKNGTEILGYTEEVGALVLYWDSMTGERDHWSDGMSFSFWKPTHWMPLPAAPGPADGESNV